MCSNSCTSGPWDYAVEIECFFISEYTMLDTGCPVQDDGYRVQTAGYRMMDTGCREQGAAYTVQICVLYFVCYVAMVTSL